MFRDLSRLGRRGAGLVLVAVLVGGLAVAAPALAGAKKPVVSGVSPSTGSTLGGTRVTISGKHFMVRGKSIVSKVRFGLKSATRVSVRSAGAITATAPRGTGTVDVRVTTRAGTSAKSAADRFAYRAPATKYLVTASSYSPVAGGAVTINAQLADAAGVPAPTAGVKVTWSKTGGGGSFASPTSVTSASGVATVTFTTGSAVGTVYTVTATDSSHRTGVSPAITTVVNTATQIGMNAGDNQTSTVGTPVATAPSVIVRDAHGDSVAGVSVTFAVASGGGSATGTTATTNASGIAAVGSWTLGAAPGANTLTATSAGLDGSPVTFTATGTAGPATQIAMSAGDGQTANVGTAVAVPPSVIVKDAGGNPVSGVSVTFAVASGGGSATGTTATTNASGIAAVGSWTLGPSPGGNALTATCIGLAGSPVTFAATGTAGVATKYLVGASTYAPLAGSSVTISAQLADVSGAPVATAGATVTWSKTGAGGSFSSATSVTDAGGIATVTFTTGMAGGTVYTVMATDDSARSGVSPPITTTAGPATQIAVSSGDGQSASAGAPVATPPSVIVKDAGGNPVSGVSVTFAVASGGGSATGTAATTNSSGVATVGSWTLGGTPGANTLTATSGTLSGSPVTFTATGTAGILQVQDNGTPVRSYSLAELESLTPFAGNFGFRNSVGNITGPEAVTGVRVTDIVADALAAPLTASESVAVIASDNYAMTYTYDQLVNLTGFAMWDATTGNPVEISSLTGPLATTLIYSNPAGNVMPPSAGPLRFVVTDATSENAVMTGNQSVKMVNRLNVLNP